MTTATVAAPQAGPDLQLYMFLCRLGLDTLYGRCAEPMADTDLDTITARGRGAARQVPGLGFTALQPHGADDDGLNVHESYSLFGSTFCSQLHRGGSAAWNSAGALRQYNFTMGSAMGDRDAIATTISAANV